MIGFAQRDETFGHILHPVDLAMNKVMAAAGRREVRDLIDLVTMHDTILPLGAVIWAAVDKSPGFTPEGWIAEIRRNAHYPAADWRAVLTEEPLDPQDISTRLRAALDEAEAFVVRMPTDKMGLLFFYRTGRWCNPPPTTWRRTRPMPGSGAATGPPAPTSPPPCSSITSTHQARHNVSSREFRQTRNIIRI
jgi:hypothetical protein